MSNDEKIKLITSFVKKHNVSYDSGHDWWHIERVRRTSLFINEKESLADSFTLEIAALMHDTADSKFSGNEAEKIYIIIGEFLENLGLREKREQIIEVIRNVSYSNKHKAGNQNDPVLLILQDADRLDAIGAIGIARAFSYGGFRNNPIYVPADTSEKNVQSTIGHFYDKLLKLKDMMNTRTGKAIAVERHQFLEKFLMQFYHEWEFDRSVGDFQF